MGPPGVAENGAQTEVCATIMLLACDFAEEHGQRIIELVDDTLLEGDDGVVRDVNFFGTNFGTAFRDVAEAEAEVVLEQSGAIEAVNGMHLEAGDADKKARAAKFFLFVMLAKNVAYVLAEEAFDTLTEFLDAVDIELGDFPVRVGARLESGNLLVDGVIPGDVRDEILDSRKRLHRHDGDGLIHGQRVHAGFAGQARAAVDFGGAGAALRGFAIPTDGEIGREMALNVMKRVENNHARSDGDFVVDGLAAGGAFAAEDS
jgi:hypothetical protein